MKIKYAFSFVLCLAFSLPSFSQVPWPEQAKNLQVLPSNTTKAELRSKMFEFSNALGVNCIHCHVAGDFNDFSTYDFAADDKETKQIARVMLQMVETINKTQLSKIGREVTVNVSCMTCHRGNSTPKSLQQTLYEIITKDGVRTAVREYHKLRERHQGKSAFDFGENTLNSLGYQLMGEGKTSEAIAIFRLNVEMFPDQPNPYDSLAEAYMTAGNKRLAIIFYSKSLELNPDNNNAVKMLEELEKE